MAIWNRVKNELDRAGRVAQSALDEGRLRLEAFRERRRADKAAQRLGYAVYRARQAGLDVEVEAYARYSSEIAAHEAEAARLEAQLADQERPTPPAEAADRPGAGPGPTGPGATAGPADANAPGPTF